MTDQPAQKFCKDCGLYGGGNECFRARLQPFNLVTGEKLPTRAADVERRHSSSLSDSCGPEAKFWTPKREGTVADLPNCRRCDGACGPHQCMEGMRG